MLRNTMGSGRYQLSRQKRYGDLTRFNKIATQGAPQMAVDKEANSLSRCMVTRGGNVSDLQGKSIVNVTWAPKGAITS